MKVKLIKIQSSHQNLRTNEIEGEAKDLPKEGERFTLLGQGIEFVIRMISTSPVKQVQLIDSNQERHLYRFETQNSQYSLEVKREPGV